MREKRLGNTFEQIPFDGNEFADNPEPRCPCVLILDTSGSMQGPRIRELNEGLQSLRASLQSDTLASRRVEMAVVTFGPVRVENPFTTGAAFDPPQLVADGDTPMGEAIIQGISLLRDRKARYVANGVPYYRPWIFLITDGSPTDAWKEASVMVHRGEESREFLFFAVGVQGADMKTLTALSPPGRAPKTLKGLAFKELFQWLSNSLGAVSRSNVGTSVSLPPPDGWTTT